MFGSLGWSEILFVFVIALIIFGPRKLPELGKSLGQSLAQFKKASEDFKRSWEEEVELEKKSLAETAGPIEEVEEVETVESIITGARSGISEGTGASSSGSVAPETSSTSGTPASSQPAERWL